MYSGGFLRLCQARLGSESVMVMAAHATNQMLLSGKEVLERWSIWYHLVMEQKLK